MTTFARPEYFLLAAAGAVLAIALLVQSAASVAPTGSITDPITAIHSAQLHAADLFRR